MKILKQTKKPQWTASVVEWKWKRLEMMKWGQIIELTWSGKQRTNRLEKLSKASGTCGTTTKYLAFISSESQKEKRKTVNLKVPEK